MGNADGQKRDAAHAAVGRFVESGATIGLGSGTTSAFVVRRIGELLEDGELRGVRGIPTSEGTAALAREVGVPTVSLAEARPTLTLDGADEIGPGLAAVKGLGGALLREKIVAAASTTGLVLVADASKTVDALGTKAPVPVEVDPYGWQATLEALSSLGCQPRLRMDAADPQQPFVTDGGHYTADCAFDAVGDPDALEEAIRAIPGALECGLFVGLAVAAVVAGDDGVSVLDA
ncbi:MAG: Ribose 5-phosphate isomerase A [uncultured Rubrobacteraceae bacterium]|uniref:Ribose 5-phosphate isomerase A n=1 Tax=uncultured Rubrobacteraceae bacterium TaxID=349277 RepID=A0A6J4U1N6_9ACTN|nr:MAG: Ribose 5-phosphate isomerase A [uncultured Rubrobacteraceae bacterium]